MSTATPGRHSRSYSQTADFLGGMRERARQRRGWGPQHRRMSLQEWGAAFAKSFKAIAGAGTLAQRDLTRAR